MRKLLIPLFLSALVFLPFRAFAAVDITLEDKSTTAQKSVDILVNTGTDVTEEIAFQIQASEDVTISSLSDESTVCSTFAYTNVSNLLTITCTLAEAKVLSGNIATILFASTSTDYAFTVSKTTGLNLGTLTLGTVTDITNTQEVTTTTPAVTITTTETETEKSFQDILTDYLPYILIGGATILLISILGILLSKKKDEKPEEVVTQIEETRKEDPVPSENRPTDIDNISGNLYTPQVKEETIQEKLEEQPVQLQSTEASSLGTESKDLADLMAKEGSPVQETESVSDFNATPAETSAPTPDFNTMPIETPTPTVEGITPVTDFNTMPVETPTPMAEETAPVMPSNLPDMQQMVNNGAVAPEVDTTPAEEPQGVPPVQPTI